MIAVNTAARIETLKQASRHYQLSCAECGLRFDDDGMMLECTASHGPSLLKTVYASEEFTPRENEPGVYRYRSWLPVTRSLKGSGRTVTYRSEKLGRLAGLSDLWIAFNGFWPEMGATLETGTFKEHEAFTTLGRISDHKSGVMVVSSAGNTAAAFAHACSLNGMPCLIVLPETGLARMQFSGPLDPCVKIVSLSGFTDYYDAIKLAERVAKVDGFFSEGGVRNVGRRDGLATTLLNAVEAIGRMPDYYFQAIGSGAGGIAVHEAATRFIRDNSFGSSLPRLMLSQNLPFVPIYNSWKARQRDWIDVEDNAGKNQIRQIAAHVLSNRRPPYSLKGGVFDVLTESNGDMLVADNNETLEAARIFEESEGIDIEPAGAVAFATLLKASRYGDVDRDATVLLNITGGGWKRRELQGTLMNAQPDLQVLEDELLDDRTLDRILGLFA